MASFRERNGRIQIDFRYNGKRKQKNLKLDWNDENIEYVKTKIIPALDRQIAAGTLDIDEAPKKSVDYYAGVFFKSRENEMRDYTLYYYMKRYETTIKPIFGSRDIDTIKRSEIRTWIKDVAGDKSQNTINYHLVIMRGIFRMALEDEAVDRNPVDGIAVKSSSKKEDVEPYTQDEVKILLKSANGQFRNIIAFAFLTGMRTSEVLGLKWEDVDINGGFIAVRRNIVRGEVRDLKTKSSKRQVPILDDLHIYIREQFKITGLKDSWVFVSMYGKPYFDASVIVKKHWMPLLRACGIHHRRFYNTRHTFAIYMLKMIGKVNGITLDVIAQILGHTNTTMLIKNYAKFIEGDHLKIDRNISLFGDVLVTSKNKTVNETA